MGDVRCLNPTALDADMNLDLYRAHRAYSKDLHMPVWTLKRNTPIVQFII